MDGWGGALCHHHQWVASPKTMVQRRVHYRCMSLMTCQAQAPRVINHLTIITQSEEKSAWNCNLCSIRNRKGCRMHGGVGGIRDPWVISNRSVTPRPIWSKLSPWMSSWPLHHQLPCRLTNDHFLQSGGPLTIWPFYHWPILFVETTSSLISFLKYPADQSS